MNDSNRSQDVSQSRPELSAYPPPSSNQDGYPTDPPLFVPKKKGQLDGYMGGLLTVMVVAGLFLFLVVLLTSIAPNSPTNLVPEPRTGSENARLGPPEEILGD